LKDGRKSDNPERIGGTEVLHSQTRAEVGIGRISHSTWCQKRRAGGGCKYNAAKHTKQKTWEKRGNFVACRPFYFLERYTGIFQIFLRTARKREETFAAKMFRGKCAFRRKTKRELTWHGEIIVGDEDGIRFL
jgi:hypothetical protein